MPLLPAWLRFRIPEWILIGFFAYLAALVPFFPDRPELGYQPFLIFACVVALLCVVSFEERGTIELVVSWIRDWLPLGLMFVGFREMELFLAPHYNHRYETAWIRWDRTVLYDWHLRKMIESLGPVIPLYLEICYLLVYGIGAYCLLLLWLTRSRKLVDRFYFIYLLGTLLAYSLFPYFPSEPPRIAFPQVAPPDITSWVRSANLWLLNSASIHSGVFPSAHVSSVFAAAWAIFLLLPHRRRFAWGLLAYAISVSVATVYGRYHYVADVVAGFAVSLVPIFISLLIKLIRGQSSAADFLRVLHRRSS